MAVTVSRNSHRDKQISNLKKNTRYRPGVFFWLISCYSHNCMTALIDTHTLLADERFSADLPQVLNRASANGITAIISVSETLNDLRHNLFLAEQHPIIKVAAGLYPEFADEKKALPLIDCIHRNRDKLVAIGEVGLDFWIAQDDVGRDRQRHIFSLFITIAKELNIPINVHSRSAGRHAVSLLLDKQATQVQMHAFDGKLSAALPAVEAGFFFSVPPSIVRSRQKQKLIKGLPLSCLLLETDSPVLGPDPQKRNEPANVTVALQAIADIKNMPAEEIAPILFDNTLRLYGNNLITDDAS